MSEPCKHMKEVIDLINKHNLEYEIVGCDYECFHCKRCGVYSNLSYYVKLDRC